MNKLEKGKSAVPGRAGVKNKKKLKSFEVLFVVFAFW